jgi:hypothetical protein
MQTFTYATIQCGLELVYGTIMDLHLNGKHILITGRSKGIGLACAQSVFG